MSIGPDPISSSLSRLEMLSVFLVVLIALAVLVAAGSIFIDVFLDGISRTAWFYRN